MGSRRTIPAGGPQIALGVAALGVACLLAAGCRKEEERRQDVSSSPVASQPPVDAAADPRIEIRNTSLRVTPHASLDVRRLRGQTVRTDPEAPVFLDDGSSFAVRVEEAEVSLEPESLAALMNEWVFAYPAAPLSDLRAEVEGDRLRLRGKLHKLVAIPFAVQGTLAPTPEGNVRFTPETIEAAGVGVVKLMDLLDLEMAELINTEEAHGVRVEGNDIVLLTGGIAPPPRMLARVTEVELEGGRLVQRLGPPADAPAPDSGPLTPSDPEAPHYIYFQGGWLRFGKLTMRDADLQIVDAEPADPFDFYLDRLKEQLVKGESRTLPDDGLLTSMPDYADVQPPSVKGSGP